MPAILMAACDSGASLASTAGLGFGAVLTYCPLQRSPLSPKIYTALTSRLAIRGAGCEAIQGDGAFRRCSPETENRIFDENARGRPGELDFFEKFIGDKRLEERGMAR